MGKGSERRKRRMQKSLVEQEGTDGIRWENRGAPGEGIVSHKSEGRSKVV